MDKKIYPDIELKPSINQENDETKDTDRFAEEEKRSTSYEISFTEHTIDNEQQPQDVLIKNAEKNINSAPSLENFAKAFETINFGIVGRSKTINQDDKIRLASAERG